MKLSRRQFLSVTGAVGAGAMTPLLWKGERAQAVQAQATHLHPMAMRGAGVMAAATAVTSPTLARFSQPLRGVYPIDPNGIPVAVPDGVRKYNGGDIVANHYTIDIRQYTDQLHADAGGPTTLWGFHSLKNLGDTATVKVPQRHLGGIIVADRNKPVQITFRNKLPRTHILPVDPTIMGAEGAPNRTCVHLHGGEVPWISDGGPFAWFRPNDDPTDTSPLYGASAQSGAVNIYKTLNRNLQAGEAEYYFPLKQSARMMWYHDHAVGITRLNAYAGIATALIVRDDFERRLVKRFGLPDFIENGGRELPLVIQDKVFHDPNVDPDYPGNNTAGSLWYPYKYTDAFALGEGGDAFDLPISAVPEMFGDTMLVNGLVTPKVTVEPRRYRLRILNATQSRFLNLSMFETVGTPGDELPDFTKPGPDYLVLGTEGGFLARAVTVPSGRRLNITVDPDTGDRTADPVNLGGALVTGPAERWDVVVDFSSFAGKSLVLYNDAPGPFPGGGADADGPTTLAPDGTTIVINQMMLRFDVAATTTAKADPPLLITNGFPLAADTNSGIDPALSGNWARLTTAPRPAPARATLRKLTLNELFDEHGRLIQMLGANKLVNLMPGFTADPGTPGADIGKTLALMYHEPATETPAVGDVEVWEIANLSADVHPIHVHLANAQVLARVPFTGYAFNAAGVGTPTGLGVERGPDPTELGWKETIRMNPGEITRIVMKFSLPRVPFTVPKSPRTGGNEFVWHCHILEHEEHDMMRPLIVRGSNPRA